MAERAGFEPAIPYGILAFQASALGQLCDLSVIGWYYNRINFSNMGVEQAF